VTFCHRFRWVSRFAITPFIRAVYFVPETKAGGEAAAGNARRRVHTMSIVIDEYGGVAVL
jgi:Mg2+/Co2+ transporter CorC